MIYSAYILFYFIALGLLDCNHAFITPFTIRNRQSASFRSVPEWLQAGESDMPQEIPQSPKLTVRFINTPSGEDIVVNDVDEGQNLLFVGDKAGVKIPRACRNGLCGTCICQVQDPNAAASDINPREGFATVRACSSRCFVPEGMTEMVVDVQNILKKKKLAKALNSPRAPSSSDAKANQPKDIDLAPKKLSKLPDEDDEDDDYNPLERFGEGWELEFRPAWKLKDAQDQKNAQQNSEDNKNAVSSTASKTAPKSSIYSICNSCDGLGSVQCYYCEGTKKQLFGDGSIARCLYCRGTGVVGCGYCQKTGKINKVKRLA